MSAWLLLLGLAHADRPDQGGGLWTYDSTDELEWVDGPTGRVRVHYSVAGTNQTRLDDDDLDGVPDLPQRVAEVGEEVVEFYEGLGFLAPITEAEVGLGDLGGSQAFDFYLVDFAGSGDGQFVLDACRGEVCAGHMLIENDFVGYGYANLDEAVEVLTSHELFHAVQAAYRAAQPSWMAEGTAVWAEAQFRPGVRDFYAFADEYLADAGRSVDSPPSGALSWFSYGTGLFFQFLSDRLGVEAVRGVQEAMPGRDDDDAIQAVVDALSELGADLSEEWVVFVRWNLATGDRAGATESYSDAAALSGVVAEAEGESIVDDNRFYPLAATYFRLNHPGGALHFATAEDPTGLVFSLHPVVSGDGDGPVGDPVHTWAPLGPGHEDLGELQAGGYWLAGTYPQVAPQSVKVAFCLGTADAVVDCAEAEADTGGDAGGEAPAGGCGCGGGGALPSGALALALAGLSLARRRARAGSPARPATAPVC